MKTWIRVVLIALAALLIVPTTGFVIWAETPLGPMMEAIVDLGTDGEVKVTNERWIVFEPIAAQPTTGLIFYPGARVDARSYARTMHAIAAQGFLAVIVPMPLNLAIFEPDAADDVIAAFPQIEHWAIGGHSMGGAMAVNYTRNHLDAIAGVVLWAAYPQASDSLADQTNMPAAAIFGANDGLVSPDERELARLYMPPDTTVLLIEGGNHAQFGSYGDQPDDAPATISRAEQQRQTVEATLALLKRL